MAYQVKKIDRGAVARQLQSGKYDNVPKKTTTQKSTTLVGTNKHGQSLADIQAGMKAYKQANPGISNTIDQPTIDLLKNAHERRTGNTNYNTLNKLQAKIDQNKTATPVMATQANQPLPQSQSNSTQSYIEQLMAARRNEQMARLGKSRDKALSNLGEERAGLAPRYYDQRNIEAAGNQQQARNFAEFMAARGGTSAGSNAQEQSMRNMSLQGNIGSLNRQETQSNDNIDRRTTDTQNAYQSDLVSLEQGLQAAKMEALISQMNQDRQFGLQEGGLTGNYNGQQTLAAQLGFGGLDLQRAGLTGNYQGDRTVQGQQLDWNMNPNNPANQSQMINNEIQQLKLQNLPQELKLGLEALEQDIKTGGLNQQQAELKLKELQDPNSITNQANRLGLEASRLGNEELRKRIDQIGKVPALSSYEKEMQGMKLESAKLELEGLKNPQSSPQPNADMDKISKMIDSSMFIEEDGYGQKTIPNTSGLRTYIISLNLSDQETIQLFQRYGLPLNIIDGR